MARWACRRPRTCDGSACSWRRGTSGTDPAIPIPFIRPLTSYTGQRGFAVTLGRHRYTVEYRTVAGPTAGSMRHLDRPDRDRAHRPGGSGRAYQDLDSALWNTTVLDLPDAPVSTRERHPGMRPGKLDQPRQPAAARGHQHDLVGRLYRVDFPA